MLVARAGGRRRVPYRKTLRSFGRRYILLLHIGVLDERGVILGVVRGTSVVWTDLPHAALFLGHFSVVLVLRFHLLAVHLLRVLLVVVLMLVILAGAFGVVARNSVLVVMLLGLVHHLRGHIGSVQVEGLLLGRGREVLSGSLIRMHPVLLLLHLSELLRYHLLVRSSRSLRKLTGGAMWRANMVGVIDGGSILARHHGIRTYYRQNFSHLMTMMSVQLVVCCVSFIPCKRLRNDAIVSH